MKVDVNGSIIDKNRINGEYAYVNDAYVGAYLMLVDKYGLWFRATDDKKLNDDLTRHFLRLRKENFPREKVYRKVRYVNDQMITLGSHIYEIDNTYFKIFPTDIKKVCVKKDEEGNYIFNEEPLLKEHTEELVTREQLLEHINKDIVGMYTWNCEDVTKEEFPSEKEILEESIDNSLALYNSNLVGMDKNLVRKMKDYRAGKKNDLTIEDFIGSITFFNRYLVYKEGDELKDIKHVHVKYAGKGKYKLETYHYHIDTRKENKGVTKSR